MFSRLAEGKRERNAAGPIVMFHEVATLVHPIESSKRAARAQGIRSVVLLEVPRILEGGRSLPSKENSWRFRVDLAYVVIRLCRLDKESSCDARRFL